MLNEVLFVEEPLAEAISVSFSLDIYRGDQIKCVLKKWWGWQRNLA